MPIPHNILMPIFWLFISLMLLPYQELLAQIILKTDRANATYQINETAEFQVTSSQNGTLNYEFFFDEKSPVLKSGSFSVTAGNTIKIPYTLSEPGVIFCKINLNGTSLKSAATFSPLSIPPLENEPADFDVFWRKAKGQLAAIPIDAQVKLEQTNANSKTYRVNLANIDGRRVYGYLTVPNGNGPFPAVLKFPPFGSSPGLTGKSSSEAERGGVLYFAMNIHNVEPDQSDPNAYQPNNLNDPDEMYFKYATLAGIRVIDYLFTRNDFDGQHIGLMGESQGGGLAIMVAGTDQRVNLLLNSNATHCQHLGSKYGKASGFPYYLNSGSSQNQQQTSKYFDNVYFAKRFQGTSWTFISYWDDVCPAATTFAAFNQLGGQRILTHSINMGHQHPVQFWNDYPAFFKRNFPTAKPSTNESTNAGYFIDAGPNQTINTGNSANLTARIAKDQVINPNYSINWTKVSGPGTVNFSNSKAYSTQVSFSQAGTYVLRFTGEDMGLINNNNPQYFTLIDELKVTVGSATCTDADQDGVCADEDCDDENPNIPTVVGSSCNDQNENTTQDAIQADGCTCVGVPISSCVDIDEDGVCADADCDDENPSLPATPNTACNDGNPNTINDVIQSDGCTCQGEVIVSDNSCTVQISAGNASLSVMGMDAPNFKLQVFDQGWSTIFFECFWNNCPLDQVITDLPSGVYAVKIQSFDANWQSICDFTQYIEVSSTDIICVDVDNDGICADADCDDTNPSLPAAQGTPCNDGIASTENDVIQPDNCTCAGTLISTCIDVDNDGICADADCDDTNASLPATHGTPCNDGIASTENDIIQSDNCTCAGTPISTCVDGDNDGICAAADCDDTNASLPAAQGTPCNDGIASTENDVILADNCTCAGTPISTCVDVDNDGVCAAEDCDDTKAFLPATPGTPCNDGNIETENDVIQTDGCTCAGTSLIEEEPSCEGLNYESGIGKINIEGLTAPIEIVRIRNSEWEEIFECIADCPNPIKVDNLPAGTYQIQVQLYTEHWEQICFTEFPAPVLDDMSAPRASNNRLAPNINLFPNPASEELLLEVKELEQQALGVIISNQLGKIIYENKHLKVENGQSKIDLQQFTNGLYFVQIKVKGKRRVGKKLIVSRLY